ncbi:hypothetical protein ACN47E_007203 [Coniothyrium glycines]
MKLTIILTTTLLLLVTGVFAKNHRDPPEKLEHICVNCEMRWRTCMSPAPCHAGDDACSISCMYEVCGAWDGWCGRNCSNRWKCAGWT